jgi:hypothetical protein
MVREVQGEAVVLHLDTGEYFGLDEIATRIWQLIVEKKDLADVEAAMCDEFDAAPEVLAKDLRELVDTLVAKRILEVDLVTGL